MDETKKYMYRTVRIRGRKVTQLADEFVKALYVRGKASLTINEQKDLCISGWVLGADYQNFVQCIIPLFDGVEIVNN